MYEGNVFDAPIVGTLMAEYDGKAGQLQRSFPPIAGRSDVFEDPSVLQFSGGIARAL
jgi:hypothetical protein